MAIPMAVMDLRILPSGLGGSNLVQSARSRIPSRSSKRLMGEKWVSQHSTCRNCGTDLGAMRELSRDFSFSCVRQVDVGLRRRKSREVLYRQWKVRATEDAEEDPLGMEGYWEGAEGKQQLNEIEDMLELIEEAENLKKAESAENGPGDLTSEEIKKQRAEKLREELARVSKAAPSKCSRMNEGTKNESWQDTISERLEPK